MPLRKADVAEYFDGHVSLPVVPGSHPPTASEHAGMSKHMMGGVLSTGSITACSLLQANKPETPAARVSLPKSAMWRDRIAKNLEQHPARCKKGG